MTNTPKQPRGTPVERISESQLREMISFILETYPDTMSLRKRFQRLGRDVALTGKRGRNPWSPSYVGNAYYGKFADGRKASPEFVKGVEAIAARIEGAPVPAFLLASRKASVRTWEGNIIDGSFVMGRSVLCATPGCNATFVGTVPWRKYCPGCRPH